MSGWGVYLIRTTTGEVGSKLDASSGTWTIELNSTESGSVKARKKDLINPDGSWRRDPLWWAPHSGGILITYTDADGEERPLVAGPITGHPSETRTELTLDWKGIGWILENRVIEKTLTYRGPSLGTIAWLLAQEAQEQKPAGRLPIVHGSPSEETGRQRTYEGWNFSNNGFGKRLSELSGVINGPDIMFRPEWANEQHTRIQWRMVHGTEHNPRIEQTWSPDFDTTAARAGITGLAVKSTATHVVNRVWITGSGEGEGTARASVEDLTNLQRGYPFLEKVISDTDQGDVAKLREKARGELAASKEMLDQLTFSVRAGERKHPAGSFFVGDSAQVTLRGWLTIPDGKHSMRIIAMNGGLDENITLDFQEDSW